MSKVDISGWKTFLIRDLFETIKNGKQVYTGANVKTTSLHDGTTPRITVSGMNNGVVGRYSSTDKNYRVYDNFISVSFLGTVFYHPYEASLDMKVHCLKPLIDSLNDETGLFLVSAIRKAISQNASYANQISSSVLPDLEIYLPATPDGDPDWNYMGAYIKSIREDAQKMIDLFNHIVIASPNKRIDIASWKEFKISELGFKNYHGQRLKVAHRKDGDIPLLTAGFENQGVAGYISNPEMETYKDAITVDMFGNAFYHDGIYTGDDNIYFFVNPKLGKNVKLFIACVINAKTTPKYSYDEQFRQGAADTLAVKLPATPAGDPDWDYMDRYVYELMRRMDFTTGKLRQVA